MRIESTTTTNVLFDKAQGSRLKWQVVESNTDGHDPRLWLVGELDDGEEIWLDMDEIHELALHYNKPDPVMEILTEDLNEGTLPPVGTPLTGHDLVCMAEVFHDQGWTKIQARVELARIFKCTERYADDIVYTNRVKFPKWQD